jgi:GNAT superfamily N-acetyltransferase
MNGFEVTDSPHDADLEALGRGLTAFNTETLGPTERRALAIFLRDPTGAVTGGLSGYTGWGWLFTQWLWLSTELRGQGLAARLLQVAETEAVARGCHGAWIDTFNPVALRVYQRQGYSVFGELEDFPRGGRRWFLQKRLG